MSSKSYQPIAPQRVAFLGLGTMGAPMAMHLARAGHEVCVYNRSAAKAQAWSAEHGGRHAPTPREAAQGPQGTPSDHGAQMVLACVGNDDDVRAVTLGPDGAFAGMAPGSLFVDHTTTSAELARELHAAAAQRGIGFVDAPVSGGQSGAQGGVLTIMCGGHEADFGRAQPLLMAYARAVTHLGAPGAGQLAKMVNQVCACGALQGLAEGIAFGQKAGLDMKRVLEVLGKGAAQSWQMDNRGSTMIDDQFDFGFAVQWMRKDLGLVLGEARRNGASMPTTALIDQFLGELIAAGGARDDFSSLVRLLR